MKNQIYHPFNKWEDHKHGFYNNSSGEEKKEFSKKVILFFEDSEAVDLYMNRIISEWKYSCEHNFTNESMNKVAYLGQSACCLAYGVPSTITMELWRKVKKEKRDIADSIAEKYISIWCKNNEYV